MIIDCHGHGSGSGKFWLSADQLVKSLDLYGVDKICISVPITVTDTPQKLIREGNDEVLLAMRKHPDRILGYCFVNPAYFKETQDEVARCVVDGGMIGVKLYSQYRINEPVQFPLIERCIGLRVPILMHAGFPAAWEGREQQHRISTGEDFEDVAKRYPEALLICGHIGGGGDWERQLKGLRGAPSVYLDTSGTVIDSGLVERCVRELGAERLLFACDTSMERGIGKILDAHITARQRRMIFSENFLGILRRRET